MEKKKYNGFTLDEHMDRINKGPDRKIYSIGIEDLVSHDESEMGTWAPMDFANAIDKLVSIITEYTNRRRRSCGPKTWKFICLDLETEFGNWSAMSNKKIRDMLAITTGLIDKGKNTEMNQKLHNEFSWAYAYWWNRFTHIKETLFSKTRLGGISKRKKIKRAAVTLRGLLDGTYEPKDVHKSFHKVIFDIKMGAIFDPNQKKIGGMND